MIVKPISPPSTIAVARSVMPRALNHNKLRVPSPRACRLASRKAATPTATSPRPAGMANSGGRRPASIITTNASPATRAECGWTSLCSIDGAKARLTAGTRPRPSRTPREPSVAIGSQGGCCPSLVW